MDQPLASSDHLGGGADGGAEAGVRAEVEEGEGKSACSDQTLSPTNNYEVIGTNLRYTRDCVAVD